MAGLLLPLAMALAGRCLPAQEPGPPGADRGPEAAAPEAPDRALHVRVLAQAEALLGSDDAVLRGEAALVVAAQGELRHYQDLLAVARDREADARLRGTVALGILAVPGVEAFLGERLEDSLTRPGPEGMAAALAMGLLPETHPQPYVQRYLQRFLNSSLRRQRPVLSALLAGLAREPHPGVAAALVELLEDEGNKDGPLRARMLSVLLQVPDALPDELRDHLLEDGRPEERAALLRALASQRKVLDDDWLRSLQRTAVRDRSPEVRAAALAYLTAIRHLPALRLGARAMKSHHPVEAAQGVRTTLQLGGGVMRRAIEDHIRATVKPALVAAMLRVLEPPYGEEFARHLTRIVGDRSRPLALRTAAGLALARAGQGSVAPALRTLFLENDDPAVLGELAAALQELDGERPGMERLIPSTSLEDARRLPARLASLLAAGHPDALPRLVEMLEDPATPPATKADLLHAYRLGTRPVVPPEQVPALPEPLQPLFR